MTEAEGDEELTVYFLDTDTEFTYVFETEDRPLKGIQVGVDKGGKAFDGYDLVYKVSLATDLITSGTGEPGYRYIGRYPLSECMDGQYPYLPIEGDDIKGMVAVHFTIDDTNAPVKEDRLPGLFANHGSANDAYTLCNRERKDYLLKTMYVYSHDTYPLLYDSRIMLFVFLAATAAAYAIGAGKDEKEDASDE